MTTSNENHKGKIGIGWKRTGRNGTDYIILKIQGKSYAVFPNKSDGKKFDFVVYEGKYNQKKDIENVPNEENEEDE